MTVELTCSSLLSVGDVVSIGWLGDEPSLYRVVAIDGTLVELEPIKKGKAA